MSNLESPQKPVQKPSLNKTVAMLSELLESEGIPARALFKVSEEKLLEIKAGPLRFHFMAMGFIFAGRADLQTHGGFLRITGDLGAVPYSAQSPVLRRCLFTVIRQERLMRHCRLQIRKKNHVIVAGGMPFKGTQSQSIITALLRLLIDCRPHLSLFREYLDFLPGLVNQKPTNIRPE